MARMTDSQKRARRYARQNAKWARAYITDAVQYQARADEWRAFSARTGLVWADAGNASSWQRLSDQAVDLSGVNATRAAHWARRSEETR